MRLRVAEIHEHPVAHIFGDKPIKAADDLGGGAVISGDDLAVILGIEAGGERSRADEIAEHHGQLPPLGIGSHRRRRHLRGGQFGAERRDGVEQPPAMPDQVDAEILQVFGRQAPQYPCVDLVRAECRLVLLEPELPQPICDIHRRHAVTLLRIRLMR